MCVSVLKEMLVDVRRHIGCLYRLAESVAMLDMLHSFAYLCTISDYSKQNVWRVVEIMISH